MISLPEGFLLSLRSHFSASEVDRLLEAISGSPITSVRINSKRSGEIERVQNSLPLSEPVPWSSSGYYLNGRPTFTADPLFHAGCYYVQEASSMFLERAVKEVISSPVRVLDLCAAPGGKSTLLASALPQGSLLVANEIHRGRARILAENIIKWGVPNVVVTSNSPDEIAGSGLLFDMIVVDAPCSGEGMFRKDHASIGEWSAENVAMCALRQRDILQTIWPILKPGGFIVYSTCTYNSQENEENVQYIVEELGAKELTIGVEPEWGVAPNYHFYPHRTRGEGFFLALLQKSGGELFSREWQPQESTIKSTIPKGCEGWIKSEEEYIFSTSTDEIRIYNKRLYSTIQQIEQELFCLVSGVTLATLRGKSVIPSHTLAMSSIINLNAFNTVELEQSEALNYLRGQTLYLPNAPLGFLLLLYQGVPLGFVKNIGNRANNLYPQEWRIRHL